MNTLLIVFSIQFELANIKTQVYRENKSNKNPNPDSRSNYYTVQYTFNSAVIIQMHSRLTIWTLTSQLPIPSTLPILPPLRLCLANKYFHEVSPLALSQQTLGCPGGVQEESTIVITHYVAWGNWALKAPGEENKIVGVEHILWNVYRMWLSWLDGYYRITPSCQKLLISKWNICVGSLSLLKHQPTWFNNQRWSRDHMWKHPRVCTGGKTGEKSLL